MSDPVIFDSASPRFALPLLFAGQAQKEMFVNEALLRADAMLHCAIAGEASSPPADPEEGGTWRVGPAATGTWAGHDGQLACRQSGQWLFVTPRDGMRALDLSTGQDLLFRGTWQAPDAPPEPSGGSVVDSEARAAIQGLIAALRLSGIFPDP